MQLAFFHGLYDEVVDLLFEVREYQLTRASVANSQLDTNGRLDFTCESLLITARLSHCLSWLLVRKAVQNGEMTEWQALQPQNRLGKVNDHKRISSESVLPVELLKLRAKSAGFYERISRLDVLIEQQAA